MTQPNRFVFEPVRDPYEMLASLAAETSAVKDILARFVERLAGEWSSVDKLGREQMRAEVSAYTCVLRDCVSAVATLTKLTQSRESRGTAGLDENIRELLDWHARRATERDLETLGVALDRITPALTTDQRAAVLAAVETNATRAPGQLTGGTNGTTPGILETGQKTPGSTRVLAAFSGPLDPLQ